MGGPLHSLRPEFLAAWGQDLVALFVGDVSYLKRSEKIVSHAILATNSGKEKGATFLF